MPVLPSHGRHDPLLTFAIAELLRDELIAAGAKPTWPEFTCGHENPAPVLEGVTKLLAGLERQSQASPSSTGT